MGDVYFRWSKTVEVRRQGKPVETADSETAYNLALTGDWMVVITRDYNGDYLGSILVESSSNPETDSNFH